MSAGTDLVVSVIYPPLTLAGGTLTGALGVGNVADVSVGWIIAKATITIADAIGTARDLRFGTYGVGYRWIIRVDGGAETGSDAGSNFSIQARSDAGAATFPNVITGSRATGIVGVNIAAASLATGNQNQLQVGGGIISKGAGNTTGLATTDRTTATQVWTWYADAGIFRLFFTTDVHHVEQSGKFGFATGAGIGGAVTQATSKATGVTLNKATGDITLNAAALASSANVSFTLTDSVIAANDLVVVSHASGGTAGAYLAWASAIAAGSCSITVRNMTAGSLSEAAVIRFAVVKAAST